jgi:hypothetical protein
MQLMAQTYEFERNLTIYKYFKIIAIKIIIQPRLTYEITPSVPGRIMYDWINQVRENILADDSAKEVTIYATRSKCYKFVPVNTVLTFGGYSVNYRDWVPTENANLINNLPGWIKISSPFSFSFTVETLVKFKGNQTNVNPQLLKVIGAKLEDDKELKIIKEEEDEEDIKEGIDEIFEGKKEVKIKKKINKLNEELNKMKLGNK